MRKFLDEKWFKDSPEGILMVGSKCASCGKTFFPKKEVCPNCFKGELKEVALSRRGKLHTYAVSIMGPPELEKPYVLGLIDLPEGIKLFSLLTECEPADKVLKTDMDMEMVIGKLKQDEDGNEVIGYKFRPVRKEAR